MKSIVKFLKKRKIRSGGRYHSEDKVKETLVEILIYMVFLIFATIVCFASRDTMMFYFTENIDKLFMQKKTITEFEYEYNYDEITTATDWWNWIENTFMNGLYGYKQNDELLIKLENRDIYANNSTKTIQNKLTDFNVLLGPPRIRQKRVKADSCHTHKIFQNYFRKCFGPFTEHDEDVKQIPLGSTYLSARQMQSYGTWGLIRYYSGGGFVEMLTFERSTTEEILGKLKEGEWIDRATRLLIVEFSLYNTNVDYFCMAQFVAEVVPGGGFHTSNALRTFKLFPVWSIGEVFIVLCMVFYYLMIVYYSFVEVLEIRYIGISLYITYLWNWVNFFMILIGCFSFIYNILNPINLNEFLIEFEKHPKEFNSVEIIAFWNLINVELMAINIFLVWVKILKYISFNKTMLQFSRTINGCAKDLAGFLIMFLIVFLAYAQMGLLLFGTQHLQFQNFGESFVTMVRMVLGDFEYEGLEKANRILGPLFFITYILLVFFILLNMFLAIINDKYAEIKNEVRTGELHLERYIMKLLRRFWQWITCNRYKMAPLNEANDEENPQDNLDSTTQNKNPPIDKTQSDRILKEYFELINQNDQSLEELKNRVKLIEDMLVDLASKMKFLIEKIEKFQKIKDLK